MGNACFVKFVSDRVEVEFFVESEGSRLRMQVDALHPEGFCVCDEWIHQGAADAGFSPAGEDGNPSDPPVRSEACRSDGGITIIEGQQVNRPRIFFIEFH